MLHSNGCVYSVERLCCCNARQLFPLFCAQVLHYLNAMVSLQIKLLHDEKQEALWTDPLITRAHKPFTCPVTLAHTTRQEAESANGMQVRRPTDAESCLCASLCMQFGACLYVSVKEHRQRFL